MSNQRGYGYKFLANSFSEFQHIRQLYLIMISFKSTKEHKDGAEKLSVNDLLKVHIQRLLSED